MNNNTCLNCGKVVSDKYCSGCGQKTDTHRISFKNFILHDVLHGTFHIEKGILFTAKQALIRPGKAALDYIAGKRISYYNVFLLILIVIGLTLFLRHFYEEILISQGRVSTKDISSLNEASRKMDEILTQKSKLIILLFVPLAALNSFVLFRRKKLNLSEHFIIAGMVLLGILLWTLFANILFYFNLVVEYSDILKGTISIGTTVIVLLYIGYGYINAFRNDYTKLGIAYRTLLFFILLLIEVFLLLLVTVGIVTNWKFGEIIITPFG